jgi:hypothetical protein
MEPKSAPNPLRNSPKVKVEQELLRTLLEEAFAKTAAECWEEVFQLEWPVNSTTEAEPIVLAAVRRWRDESMKDVSSAFSQIHAAATELLPDLQASADAARELTWEVIYPVFQWTEQDTTNDSKFKEWQFRATGASFMWLDAWRPASPDCDYLQRAQSVNLAERLHCDFRTQFDRLLTVLRLRAFRTPNTSASQEWEPGPARAPEDGRPHPYVEDPDLKSPNRLKLAAARVRLLDRVDEELAYLRPLFERGEDPEELAKEYESSGFVVFQQRRMKKLLLDRKLLDNKAFKTLSYQIAAAKAANVSTSYMEKARQYYKRLKNELEGSGVS